MEQTDHWRSHLMLVGLIAQGCGTAVTRVATLLGCVDMPWWYYSTVHWYLCGYAKVGLYIDGRKEGKG